MYSDNYIVIDFTIKGLLIDEKIKVKVSFLNLAKESSHVTSPIPKRYFSYSGDSDSTKFPEAWQVYSPLRGQCSSLLLVRNYERPSRCRQNIRCHSILCGNFKVALPPAFSFCVFSVGKHGVFGIVRVIY